MMRFNLTNLLSLLLISSFLPRTIVTTLATTTTTPPDGEIFREGEETGGIRFTYDFILSLGEEGEGREGVKSERLPLGFPTTPGRRYQFKVTPDLSYLCQLPPHPDHHDPLLPLKSNHRPPPNFLEKTKEILHALTGQCMKKSASGGWYYMICYGVEAAQIYAQPSTTPGKEEEIIAHYTLGNASYSVPPFPSTPNLTEVFHGGPNSLPPYWYVSQRWTQGTICPDTQLPREVEIKYGCADSTEDGIVSVEEKSVCNYRLGVHLSELCKFNPQEEVLPPGDTVCAPILRRPPTQVTVASVTESLPPHLYLIHPMRWWYRWYLGNKATCRPDLVIPVPYTTLANHFSFVMGADTWSHTRIRPPAATWSHPSDLYLVTNDRISPTHLPYGALNLHAMFEGIRLGQIPYSLTERMSSTRQLLTDLLTELSNPDLLVYSHYAYSIPPPPTPPTPPSTSSTL